MTCKNTSCKFEFCWVCLGSWKDHAGSYYACNRYYIYIYTYCYKIYTLAWPQKEHAGSYYACKGDIYTGICHVIICSLPRVLEGPRRLLLRGAKGDIYIYIYICIYIYIYTHTHIYIEARASRSTRRPTSAAPTP